MGERGLRRCFDRSIMRHNRIGVFWFVRGVARVHTQKRPRFPPLVLLGCFFFFLPAAMIELRLTTHPRSRHPGSLARSVTAGLEASNTSSSPVFLRMKRLIFRAFNATRPSSSCRVFYFSSLAPLSRPPSHAGSIACPAPLHQQGVQAPQRCARARKARLPDRDGILVLPRRRGGGHPSQADLGETSSSLSEAKVFEYWTRIVTAAEPSGPSTRLGDGSRGGGLGTRERGQKLWWWRRGGSSRRLWL